MYVHILDQQGNCQKTTECVVDHGRRSRDMRRKKFGDLFSGLSEALRQQREGNVSRQAKKRRTTTKGVSRSSFCLPRFGLLVCLGLGAGVRIRALVPSGPQSGGGGSGVGG